MSDTIIHKPLHQEVPSLGVPLDNTHFIPVYVTDPSTTSGVSLTYVSASEVLGGGGVTSDHQVTGSELGDITVTDGGGGIWRHYLPWLDVDNNLTTEANWGTPSYGGGLANIAIGYDAKILTVGGAYNVIAGGRQNRINNSPTGATNYASVLGGFQNQANGTAAIAGGRNNVATDDYAMAFGGLNGVANGDYTISLGGNAARATENYCTVIGGSGNTASGPWSSIINGSANTLGGGNLQYSQIFGGRNNTLVRTGGNSQFSTIINGTFQTIENSPTSIIAGGDGNRIIGRSTANTISVANSIVGGTGNVIDANSAAGYGYHSTIIGGRQCEIRGFNFAAQTTGTLPHNFTCGYQNKIRGEHVTVFGYRNEVLGDIGIAPRGGAILTGESNKIGVPEGFDAATATSYNTTSFCVIGGGARNKVGNIGGAGGCFIGAGDNNDIEQGNFHFIGGGNSNRINATIEGGCVIGGGVSNYLGERQSVLVGGQSNSSSSRYGFLGGGLNNSLPASNIPNALVCGNDVDQTTGINSATLMGRSSQINSSESTLLNGLNAKANANSTLLWGAGVTANGAGSAVFNCTGNWAVGYDQYVDNGSSSFNVKAHGGVWFQTAAGVGTHLPPGGTGWVVTSDRQAKTNAVPVVITEEILDAMLQVEVVSCENKALVDANTEAEDYNTNQYPLDLAQYEADHAQWVIDNGAILENNAAIARGEQDVVEYNDDGEYESHTTPPMQEELEEPLRPELKPVFDSVRNIQPYADTINNVVEAMGGDRKQSTSGYEGVALLETVGILTAVNIQLISKIRGLEATQNAVEYDHVQQAKLWVGMHKDNDVPFVRLNESAKRLDDDFLADGTYTDMTKTQMTETLIAAIIADQNIDITL